jgi:hypothetical protein
MQVVVTPEVPPTDRIPRPAAAVITDSSFHPLLRCLLVFTNLAENELLKYNSGKQGVEDDLLTYLGRTSTSSENSAADTAAADTAAADTTRLSWRTDIAGFCLLCDCSVMSRSVHSRTLAGARTHAIPTPYLHVYFRAYTPSHKLRSLSRSHLHAVLIS